MRINGCRYRTRQRMSRPNTDYFARNAALFAPAYKRMPQLVGVMIREQPLHSRLQSVQIYVLCLFKIDIRQHTLHHRCKRHFAFDYIFTHTLFACFAFKPRSVNDFQACKLASPKSRVQKHEKRVRGVFFEICKAMIDQLLFFLVSERRSALTLVVWYDHLFHRRGNVVVLRNHIEDTTQ